MFADCAGPPSSRDIAQETAVGSVLVVCQVDEVVCHLKALHKFCANEVHSPHTVRSATMSNFDPPLLSLL